MLAMLNFGRVNNTIPFSTGLRGMNKILSSDSPTAPVEPIRNAQRLQTSCVKWGEIFWKMWGYHKWFCANVWKNMFFLDDIYFFFEKYGGVTICIYKRVTQLLHATHPSRKLQYRVDSILSIEILSIIVMRIMWMKMKWNKSKQQKYISVESEPLRAHQSWTITGHNMIL